MKIAEMMHHINFNFTRPSLTYDTRNTIELITCASLHHLLTSFFHDLRSYITSSSNLRHIDRSKTFNMRKKVNLFLVRY
jgi:hypothetical protein